MLRSCSQTIRRATIRHPQNVFLKAVHDQLRIRYQPQCLIHSLPCRAYLSTFAHLSAATPSPSSPSLPPHQLRLSRIRNLGIIAHIDAGKTTTAERLLFYSRRTRFLGDVDRGDTVLDYMREERERGITIQAAGITINWTRVGPCEGEGGEHRLNLIDTPGHVDFTQQVEQSLRVLDGAICVLDGVKGVEAQTMCVWDQAARYGVARIAFVNKMDRDGANFTRAVASIREKLHSEPLVITLPLFSETNSAGGDGTRPAFIGVIDLVRMETWEWGTSEGGVSTVGNLSGQADDGSKFIVKPLTPSHRDYPEALQARRDLLEKLSEIDDRLMEVYMEVVSDDETGHLKLPSKEIVQALRRVTIALPSSSTSTATSPAPSQPQPYTIVMCGSSKSNKGVQYLLNAVLDYLPSPLDKQFIQVEEFSNKPTGNSKKSSSASTASSTALATTAAQRPVGSNPSKESLLALAFKVTHDLQRGAMPIVFVRVYTGTLKKGDSILSVSPNIQSASDAQHLPKERPQKLLEISADNMTMELSEIESGNIGALVGMKTTKTGDTILASSAGSGSNKLAFMSGISFNEPVFFCSVEAGSISAAKALDQALVCLQREDPSLHVSVDSDSGQTILAGMGELHLEIIKSRLERDFNLGETEGGGGIEFGAMRISYREGVDDTLQTTFKHSPTTALTEMMIETSLTVRISPSTTPGSGVTIETRLPSNLVTTSPNVQALQLAAESGAKDSLARGPLLGYPITDVHVRLSNLTFPGPPTQAIAQSIRTCAARAVGQLLREAKAAGTIHLLEPVMACELTLSSAHLGDVLTDMTSKRRGSIIDVTQLLGADLSRSQVEAEVPLAAMLGYATVLRSTTQGNGSFSMKFKQFRPVPPHLQQQLIDSPP